MMEACSRRTFLGNATAIVAVTLSGGLARRADAAAPIKLGAALSLTGRFSDSAKYAREGYLLWADQVNAHGGINGRPVEIVIYDDESNPDTGRVLAERLIDRDRVIGILGPYSSPITDAMATSTERAQVPMLGTIASDSSIWARRKLRWTFQAFPSSDYDLEGFLAILHAKGPTLKKLAILFEETPFSIAAKDWATAKGKENGLTVMALGHNPGAQEFRSTIERFVAFGAEAIAAETYYQPGIGFTRQLIERGYNPVAYWLGAPDPVTKDALGKNVEGTFSRSPWEASVKSPANTAFIQAYETKFNRTPAYHSAAAYAAGQVFEAALKAKGPDPKAIRDFLASGPVPSLMGTFRVNAKGQQDGYRYLLIQWQSGTAQVVGPGSTHPTVWPKPKWS